MNFKNITRIASLSEPEPLISGVDNDPRAIKDLAVPSHIHTTSVHSFTQSHTEQHYTETSKRRG